MRRIAPIAAATIALLTGGCGGDGGSTVTRTTATTAAQAPTQPTARFTFTDGGLRPATAVVAAAPEVLLTIVAADGRPHGVVVQTPAGRVRVVVEPGATRTTPLRGLRAGRRYRVVPDGATEPVTLQVR